MCCSVLQCVALCVAVCCSVLQCVAVCCSVLQCVAVCCSVLQCVVVCLLRKMTCDLMHPMGLHHPARHALHSTHIYLIAHFNTLQHTATRCNTLQHAATHCNTLPWCHGKHQVHAQLNRYAWSVVHVVWHTPRVLQCVAACCSVLQRVAACCSVLQCATK